ncbi:hypothetical protein Hanom_Chr09g00771391 [Helianthus anomalus]
MQRPLPTAGVQFPLELIAVREEIKSFYYEDNPAKRSIPSVEGYPRPNNIEEYLKIKVKQDSISLEDSISFESGHLASRSYYVNRVSEIQEVLNVAEEFYNTFYNAFTSESSKTSIVTPKTITKEINENIKHDNFYGTHSKPPTLESIEDYTWWKERFLNWAKAYVHESWFCLEFGYERPKDDKGEDLPLKNLSIKDKSEFAAEQRTIALIQSSIRNDMFALLQHDGSSKSVWEALQVKAEGGKQIKKNKIALLKKEFDLFDSLNGESVQQMIECFCHLKIKLERFKIERTREEIIDKITETLPRADQLQTFVFILKNNVLYETISFYALIEKIETHELELHKQSKMSSSSHQQNVDLYHKGNIPSVKVGESPKTTFSGEKIKEPQASSSSYNSGYHSSSSKAISEESEEILFNIALKLKISPAMSVNSAKQQMSFLASVLESYEGLVAGKIGNSELTKEDYDQIDPEEMELIDIRWCLASCIRRAQRYMEITGKQSIGGPSTKLGFDKSKVTYFKCKQKGHFKREHNNSVVDGNEDPFNDDYYRKAIYHRSKEEPKMIENNPSEKSRACEVIHDDEGYDWSQILPKEVRLDKQVTTHGRSTSKSKHYVFVAEIKEETRKENVMAEVKVKTREEILKEKTYRERNIASNRIDEMKEEYESVVSNKRWDKKRCWD